MADREQNPNNNAQPSGWNDADWEALIRAIRAKQCTPFLGAGACAGVLPLGGDIARQWAVQDRYPFSDKHNLVRVAQFVAVQSGSPLTPKRRIVDQFTNQSPPDFSDPSEPHRVVAEFQLPVYITTNYDDFMMQAIRYVDSQRGARDQSFKRRQPQEAVCKWHLARSRKRVNFDLDSTPDVENPVIFHMHGYIRDANSMVLTEDDYLDFLMNISEERDLIPPRIEEAFTTSALLFLGYSLEDMNFKVLFRKLVSYMQISQAQRHVSVQLAPKAEKPDQEEIDRAENQREYMERHLGLRNVKIYWGDCHDFTRDLLLARKRLQAMTNSESPYVGPRPFTKDDEKIFYGRDAEAQALMSLIMSHSAVLLYSQSGAGKTSLLNAKVRHMFEPREVEFLGSARVRGSLPPGVDPAGIDNIFVYFALTSLEGEEPAKKTCDGKTTLPEYLKKVPRRTRSDGGLVQRVIFFDQFEEIFTTSQQRWEDRTRFFEQVGQALEDDPLLRVVFAMREEYLASLNVHVSHLPERLRTRFHLERLRYKPALDAVTKPLKGTNREFAPNVAEQLVQNLLRVPVRSETGFQEITGEFVEPVQLQVVCQNIWNSLNDDVNVINAEFVESCGDVDVALTNYYDDCLRRLIEKHTIKETRVRRWFDNELITADGLRGIVYQGDKTTGSLPNEVVSTLEDLRLVRAEPRGGLSGMN